MDLRRRAYRLLSDHALLARLVAEGQEAEAAWKEFLRRYSNLFLKIIWQFETDQDAVMDAYLYVCSRLAANNLAILRKFSHDYSANPPKFTTWLYAVVRNLCVDAHRAAHGRRRYPSAIARLSAFDRLVFALYYWDGYTVEEIEYLTENSPRRNNGSVAEGLARIDASLTPVRRQRLLHSLKPDMLPYADGMALTRTMPVAPDLLDEAQVEQWLAVLSEEERLVVRLRFWEDMTGSEIADVLSIEPTQRVYSLLKKALKRLRQHTRSEPDC
jgi:DNA-directed RNA polymerase specialized sigma24 family protein